MKITDSETTMHERLERVTRELRRIESSLAQLFDDGVLYCDCDCGCDYTGHDKDCDVCQACRVAAVLENRSVLHPEAK